MAYYGPPRDPTDVMGRRVVAYLIDFLLLAAIYAILFASTAHRYSGAPTNACQILRDRGQGGACVQMGSTVWQLRGGGAGVTYGFGLLAGFLDLVVLQSITGASIGKLIMGLRVVGSAGDHAAFWRILVRWIFLPIDLVCLVLGLIIASVTHPHRRIGDMVAGTFVIGSDDAGRPINAAAPVQQPAYAGAQWNAPTAGQPSWGATPPAAAWGTQPAPPQWGTPPPPPPPPPAAQPQPQWGAPPAAVPPPPPPAPQPQQWTAQPPPAPPGWQTPPPAAAPPPPPPPPAPAPPSWNAPPPAAPPPPPAAPTPPPAPEPSTQGESWWDKALGGEDEEEQ